MPTPAGFRASSRISSPRSHSGTRCWRPAFIRFPETVHTALSLVDFPPHRVAHLTAPRRAQDQELERERVHLSRIPPTAPSRWPPHSFSARTPLAPCGTRGPDIRVRLRDVPYTGREGHLETTALRRAPHFAALASAALLLGGSLMGGLGARTACAQDTIPPPPPPDCTLHDLDNFRDGIGLADKFWLWRFNDCINDKCGEGDIGGTYEIVEHDGHEDLEVRCDTEDAG